jgi:uncharacterized membrane protein YhdT
MEIYAASHWASARERCPACGGALISRPTGEVAGLTYEHYDSSADIQFDLKDLLGPDQLRETRWILAAGVGLMVLAFGARLAFVILGRLEGFWAVPVWFDAIVVGMLLLAVVLIISAARRLVRHRRVLNREGGG